MTQFATGEGGFQDAMTQFATGAGSLNAGYVDGWPGLWGQNQE